jgi:uncharacterized membrane protein
MNWLVLGMIGFVGGHFLLSWPPLRARLVGAMGEARFSAAYAILAAVTLAVAISGYRESPPYMVWNLGVAGRWVPVIVMPFALMLAVLGLTTKSATAVGGDKALAQGLAPRGIFTVTRHPFLWGTGLWALAHLAPNGDVPSLILFGGMAILSFGGMLAIDHKRAVRSGAAWQKYASDTSLVPFGAVARGRSIDWGGIGWVRPVAALFLYLALFHGHRWLFGVSALPNPAG